jgi:hypothetical protein
MSKTEYLLYWIVCIAVLLVYSYGSLTLLLPPKDLLVALFILGIGMYARSVYERWRFALARMEGGDLTNKGYVVAIALCITLCMLVLLTIVAVLVLSFHHQLLDFVGWSHNHGGD